MVTIESIDRMQSVEEETQRIGQMFWQRLGRRRPSVLERRWWDDRLMDWALADESVKVQMFRFVDVLPSLRTHQAVTQHLKEYFEDVQRYLPWAARLALETAEPNSMFGKAIAVSARRNAMRVATRFIAGQELNEIIDSLRQIRQAGHAFTLDLLGEAVLSHDEADQYQQRYLALIKQLAEETELWPEDRLLDRDDEGSIPVVNVSLKLSSLDPRFNPSDPVGTFERVAARLRPILRTARATGTFVNIDMEHFHFKSLTHLIFRQIFMEPEFREMRDVGIVIQAYLKDAVNDAENLLAWVRERETSISVRLVKGAFWDYETVTATARNWPVPVWPQKWQSDDSFERLTIYLFENRRWLKPAIASHNVRSMSHALGCAKAFDVPAEGFELQLLYGMADDQAALYSELGYRVRIYAPFRENDSGNESSGAPTAREYFERFIVTSPL